MKRLRTIVLTCCTLIALAAPAQSIINFNNASLVFATNYHENVIAFNVTIPTRGSGSPNYDGMGIVPGTYANNPQNNTPFLIFIRQYSPDDYVSFSLSSGSLFGLISVQLADPHSPSLTTLPITFLGYKLDGSTVSDTFTTPENGANALLNYQFTPDFASGLTSVKINASRWAMDNLVFAVPEPGTVSIILASLMSLALSRRRAK